MQEAADGHRVLRRRPILASAQWDAGAERPAAEGQADEDDHHDRHERNSPGRCHPRRFGRAGGGGAVMEFVEPDPATRWRYRHQIGGKATVVRFAEKAVAKDKGIRQRHQLAMADVLPNGQDVTRVIAKQRHL
jgi:hypothetical protein